MYVIIKIHEKYGNLFYRFSSDETDLYCVATDNIDTATKYTEAEMQRLKNSELLGIRGVKFYKLGFTILGL